MTQSQILNANFDWLQVGKKEHFPEYKIDTQKTMFDRIAKAKRSTFDRSKFTVVGSPSITSDGVASSLSNLKYLKMPKLGNFNTLKILSKFKYSSDANQALLSSSGGTGGISVSFVQKKLQIALSSDGVNADIANSIRGNELNLDTYYYLRIVFDGVSYKFDISTDNINFTNYITVNNSTKIYSENEFWLGSIGNYWVASGLEIDLKYISIEIDGKEIFNGNKTSVDQIKKDDYTNLNNGVTVNNEGIASNFTVSNYLTKSISFNARNSITYDFIIDMPKEAPSHFISFFDFGKDRDQYGFYIPANDTAIVLQLFGDYINGISVGNKYHIIATAYSNGTYSTEWTNLETNIKGSKSGSSTYFNDVNGQTKTIALGNIKDWDTPWDNNINLNNFKVYFDGNLVYQPTLRIPYIQSKTGEKIVDSVYRDRVQDMYEQFGYTHYYTLGDEPEKYNVNVVGSPTLVGGVASGFSGANKIEVPITLSEANNVVIKGCFIYYKNISRLKALFSKQFQQFGLYLTNTYNIQLITDKVILTSNALTLTNGDIVNYELSLSSNAQQIKVWKNGTLFDTKNATESITYSVYPLLLGRNDWYAESYLVDELGLDLSQFLIEVDGKEVFRGYEPAILDAYTLQTVPNEKIVDSYYADNSFMELTADLTLTQAGGAVSGQTVNLKRPYINNKYISTIGTTSKATNSFVASASGQWITKGKGVLG